MELTVAAHDAKLSAFAVATQLAGSFDRERSAS